MPDKSFYSPPVAFLGAIITERSGDGAVIRLGGGGDLFLNTPDKARELLRAAAEALAILDPPIPYLPAYLKPVPAPVVPLNASVQPAFCADCGSPEGLVPLVFEDGVCRCWDAERCDQRQAQAAGYGLSGGST